MPIVHITFSNVNKMCVNIIQFKKRTAYFQIIIFINDCRSLKLCERIVEYSA
jgi:hypothetical protein